jgi:hypothetical protein
VDAEIRADEVGVGVMGEEITSWIDYLYEGLQEPKKMTAEEAYQAGRRGNGSSYNAAAKKAARILYEAAKENRDVAKAISQLCRLQHHKEEYDWYKNMDHTIWEDMLFNSAEYVEYALKVNFPERSKEFDDVGLSMFQAGWVFQAAAKCLFEDKLVNKRGWVEDA